MCYNFRSSYFCESDYICLCIMSRVRRATPIKIIIQMLQSWPRDSSVVSVKPSVRFLTRVIFMFWIVPKYAYDMHPLSVRRQAINRLNDGLMSFEACSTRFMALNNNTLIFTKENAFENVVCTIWAFWYRYQCARTIAPRFPELMCHQLFHNNATLV